MREGRKVFSSTKELLEKYINPKMYIHIASTMARPNAMVNQLIRMYYGENPDFIISVTAVHGNLHGIALSGIAKKVITGFLGDNYPKPRANSLYKEVLTKEVPFSVTQTSLLTLIQRLIGGATGLPYVLTRSLVGSDLPFENKGEGAVINSRYKGNEEICFLKSLTPEITLVHGICADEEGNIILSSPAGEGEWGALAAQKGVLATVEKIVSKEVVAEHGDRVTIPGNRVLGLCEVPFGAYPQSLRSFGIGDIRGYYDDYDYFSRAQVLSQDERKNKEWLEKTIIGSAQGKYREHIPEEKMKELLMGEEQHYSFLQTSKTHLQESGEPTRNEVLAIMAARQIIRLVKKRKYKILLAGIGISHIASWMAKKMLEKEGILIHAMAEMGFYGMEPVEDDVFLFSQRHAEYAQQRSDVQHILGTQVGYGKQCLGVLGAAEIDPTGDINTTQLEDGMYLTGSGGANDVASVADCMVICAPGKRRFVKKVAFVTSPGRNVRSIVTTYGSFEREEASAPFHLSTWNNENGGYRDIDTALRETSQWENICWDKAEVEKEITGTELELIRKIDRKGIYRK